MKKRVRDPVVELARREAIILTPAHRLDGEKLVVAASRSGCPDVISVPGRCSRSMSAGARVALMEDESPLVFIDDGQALLSSLLKDLEVAAGHHRAGGVVGLGCLRMFS